MGNGKHLLYRKSSLFAGYMFHKYGANTETEYVIITYMGLQELRSQAIKNTDI